MEGTEQARRRRRRKVMFVAIWSVLTTAAAIYARCGREPTRRAAPPSSSAPTPTLWDQSCEDNPLAKGCS